jgi:enterochelin esterase-like enzyme
VSLTGTPLLVLITVLVVLAPLLVVVRWRAAARRRQPNGAVASTGRLLALVGCQLTATFLTFLVANNSYGFYTSWTDLTGVGIDKPPRVSTYGLVTKGEGRIEKMVVRGGPSGANADVLMWLPPEYDDKRFADTKFPVLMVLPGQPSQVQTMFKHFDFGAVASQEIASGRVKPFVAVFPPLMIDPPRDTECTDVDGGPEALTWLQKDVPEAALKKYRVSADTARWSVTGWSTGGFCAAKLLLTDPGRFIAAATLGGYFEPLTDGTTGKLFKNKTERNANSPLHLYENGGLAPGRSLLLVSGRQDAESWPMTQPMIAATKGDRQVYTYIFARGGHNYRNYKDLLPGVLGWFQTRGVFG